LTRIESCAFYKSSLQSIIIPRNVQFIDSSAFISVRLSSISSCCFRAKTSKMEHV
jgi:hypothetical protein